MFGVEGTVTDNSPSYTLRHPLAEHYSRDCCFFEFVHGTRATPSPPPFVGVGTTRRFSRSQVPLPLQCPPLSGCRWLRLPSWLGFRTAPLAPRTSSASLAP